MLQKNKTKIEQSRSAKALLDLAQMAKKIPTQGKIPIDAVKNMDFYTWGGKKHG